jgi:hypothetical protein
MKIDKKLMGYVAAAAAASLVGADSADAEIVVRSGGPLSTDATVDVDFDNILPEEYRVTHSSAANNVSLVKDIGNTLSTNAYVITNNTLPGALPANTLIGPSSTYSTTYDAVLATAGGGPGNFSVDNTPGNYEYLGVKFQLAANGPTYYGWVELDITNAATATGTLARYAYEDTGAAIAAGQVPEPTGLALLALGAPFLLRRKRD